MDVLYKIKSSMVRLAVSNASYLWFQIWEVNISRKTPKVNISIHTQADFEVFWIPSRGRAKVCVLTEMSLFFLSQINTFNASSSLKKNCNKFMYWNHGQRISCMIIWESLQRFLFIWNNFFLCFWPLQHFFQYNQWMYAEKRKWLSPKRKSSIQRSGFFCKIFLHYWNHFMWKVS